MRIRFLHTFFHPDRSSVAQLLGDVAFSLASHMGTAERIAIIQNWVDDEVIVPIPPAESLLRQELGLGDAFAVMYSGNMVPTKQPP
jgi:hypothetical protein